MFNLGYVNVNAWVGHRITSYCRVGQIMHWFVTLPHSHQLQVVHLTLQVVRSP